VRIPPLLFGTCAAAFLGACGKVAPPGPVPVGGQVVFADGTPVRGVILTLHPADEATKSARVHSVLLGDQGVFAFECIPGRYKATIGAIPKSGGAAAIEGPSGAIPGPPVPKSGKPPQASLTPLHPRYADVTQTPLVVDVPAGGVKDLVLTVR